MCQGSDKRGILFTKTSLCTCGGEILLGVGQFALLEAISTTGSIRAACKVVGLSYRTAWKAVEEMNIHSREVLVRRTTGGKGGGGAVVTQEGKELLSAYKELLEYHQDIMGKMRSKYPDLGNLLPSFFPRKIRISARNQWEGTVISLCDFSYGVSVRIQIQKDFELTAQITRDSCRELGIELNKRVFCFLKSTEVYISRSKRPEFENSFSVVLTEVSCENSWIRANANLFAIEKGAKIQVLCKQENCEFHPGESAFVSFVASSVLLGVQDEKNYHEA